jgi:SAM-dependent methyltransferase
VTDEAWLAATWPFVRDNLPAPPGRVLEVGCGALGGFVPRMRELGYEAIGVDPEAPEGPEYRQMGFEHYRFPEPFDAVVACTSLHHVADLDVALDRMESALTANGTVVVVEWAHERFDEASARWCFDRATKDGDGWLQHHRAHWRESGQRWEQYFREWTNVEGLHPGSDILRGLQARFDTVIASEGPYFFVELDGVSFEDEQSAIDAGTIQANGLRYVGTVR